VNELLEEAKFDDFAETECAKFYAENNGRPSLTPGIYFRILLLGYFEGIDSERGMAWRAADSLGVRQFLGIGLDEPTPDHSTISRTRRLMDIETHKKVFSWILEVLRERGLIHGKTVSRQNGGDRCDHIGGQRSDAFDRATGHGGKLRRVSNGFSEEIRNRDADTGRSSARGSDEEEQSE